MNQDNSTPDSYVRWAFYPEGTLAALRMLLLYFGFPEYGKDRDSERLYVYPSDFWRARVLLGCYNTKAERQRQEYLNLGKDWESNLVTAGINSKTLQVADRKRWALTWEGLKKKRPTFYPEKIESKYERDEFIPEEDAFHPRLVMGQSKKQETRINEIQAQSNHLSRGFWNMVRPPDVHL
jgi:hypothetical protein